MTNISNFVKKINAIFLIVIFYKNNNKKFILLKSIDKYAKILYTIPNRIFTNRGATFIKLLIFGN